MFNDGEKTLLYEKGQRKLNMANKMYR